MKILVGWPFENQKLMMVYLINIIRVKVLNNYIVLEQRRSKILKKKRN